jgi:flavin reductase (DIM6/NTAB) family NADH-FMN oxidoreductase RutF
VEDYFTARVYSRYEHNDHFAIFGRVENVTNTNYQYFGGEPALPIGFYGGVELKF